MSCIRRMPRTSAGDRNISGLMLGQSGHVLTTAIVASTKVVAFEAYSIAMISPSCGAHARIRRFGQSTAMGSRIKSHDAYRDIATTRCTGAEAPLESRATCTRAAAGSSLCRHPADFNLAQCQPVASTTSQLTRPTTTTSCTPSCRTSSMSGSSAPSAHLYPEFFRDELTNKDDEAVANPARFQAMGSQEEGSWPKAGLRAQDGRRLPRDAPRAARRRRASR